MELQIFNNKELAYSNKAVFKAVSLEPSFTITVKRFDYADMINTSVLVVEDVSDATYCILDDKYHYFVTSVNWISGERKYKIGLIRNIWTEIDNVSVLDGIINRGYTSGISQYKPNSIQLSQQKQEEIRVKDVFMDKYDSPEWGYLFVKGGSSSVDVSLNKYSFSTTDTKYDGVYYHEATQSAFQNYTRITNKLLLYYAGKYYSADSNELNISFDLDGKVNITCVSYTGDISYSFFVESNAIIYQIYSDSAIKNIFNGLITINATANGFPDSYKLNNGQKSSESFSLNSDISFGGVDYLYKDKEELATISTKYYSDELGDLYKPIPKYSTIYVETGNKEKFEYYKSSNSTPEYGTISFYVGSTSLLFWIQSPSSNTVVNNATIKSMTVSYEKVADASSVSLPTALFPAYKSEREPYTILALPLFDIGGWDGASSRNLFNAVISATSGDSAITVDAQILPYAPTAFKNAWTPDTDSFTNDGLTVLGTYTNYNGAPLVAIYDPDITVTDTIFLNPYNDVQKEYTCRTYRLQAVGHDDAYDFKYYDYNTANQTNGYIEFNVDITLKPFGTYMHCAPRIYNNSIVGLTDFDDIRGVVCGKGIFECTVESSAFETYRRQNVMYEDIQQRTIETMQINQDVERVNERVGAITSVAQTTAMGAMAGGQFGVGGAIAGGAISAVGSSVAYGVQMSLNDKIRDREIEDSNYYYNANLATVKALPNSINRVSQLNQDILHRFAIIIEVYDAPYEQRILYDKFVEQVGNKLDVTDSIKSYLSNGKYIQADVFKTDAVTYVAEQLKNDLKRGVYYYESI